MPKDITACLLIAFLMFSVAFYAHENKPKLIEQAKAQTIETETEAETQTCQKIDGTVYCYDKPESLEWALGLEKKKTIKAFVTQYSRADSCHNIVKGKCLMASGKEVYEGAVACPRTLKLGTKVRIGGKTYTCEDRYSKWLDAKRGLPTFDIFVNKNPNGLKKVDVEIL